MTMAGERTHLSLPMVYTVLTPTFGVQPAQGVPGEQIAFSGAGFGPGEPVRIVMGSANNHCRRCRGSGLVGQRSAGDV